jgi:hypothetical protein
VNALAEETMEAFGLPPGRYAASLDRVELEQDERGGAHFLDLVCTVERNGKRVIESRKMGKGSPYDISDGQRRSLRSLAKRLGVVSASETMPAEDVVAALRNLTGTAVTARVRPNPMGGLAVTLFAQSQNGGAVSGEVLDRMPAHEPEYTERTVAAQGAHEQLLTGLNHANRGLTLAAEACHRLLHSEGWTALGYDSVGQYLASPEIAMSRAQFYALADIWEQYVIQGGQDEQRLCAPSKLEVPLKALKAGDVTPEEALADAEELGLRDLRKKYRGEKEESGRPERPPSFPFGCAHCGSLIESTDDVVERHPE